MTQTKNKEAGYTRVRTRYHSTAESSGRDIGPRSSIATGGNGAESQFCHTLAEPIMTLSAADAITS